MKSKKNKMKLSRKKNNIKGYNKIIRGGASLTTPQIKAIMAAKAATNPKSVPPKRAPTFNTRIKELRDTMGSQPIPEDYNKHIQNIQEQMAKDAQKDEAMRQEHMTKLAYLQQLQRLGQMQQDERTQLSQQFRKESQDLRNFLEKRIKDYRNMAKKLKNEANLINWVNEMYPLLKAAEEK